MNAWLGDIPNLPNTSSAIFPNARASFEFVKNKQPFNLHSCSTLSSLKIRSPPSLFVHTN